MLKPEKKKFGRMDTQEAESMNTVEKSEKYECEQQKSGMKLGKKS